MKIYLLCHFSYLHRQFQSIETACEDISVLQIILNDGEDYLQLDIRANCSGIPKTYVQGTVLCKN